MIHEYQKNPVIIRAVQFTRDTWTEVLAFTDGTARDIIIPRSVDGVATCVIPTLEGQHIATEGDFIIRGVQGEFYPCKPDIFAATYTKLG